MIARREGIGDILASGIRAASRAWGVEDLAVHVKGMEPAGYDPRVLKGMGLTFGTAPRGACHLRTTFYKPELAGMIPADQVTEKAAMLTDYYAQRGWAANGVPASLRIRDEIHWT
ncbi:aldehyde ferredoxin oxidoreductase C-terminal domain-containing protein [Desulfosarcina ovata]|uniref:Aldehyde ferredoxin oxidoreductase C-terminal domain-containing protein n=2 Tax=Desulfosarcina ovata TaxID=83564 RepID=A0A5K8AHJ6_9BACT|nr:aldehyde ferredoxin oxidoreductase C-terminal domain-containing protein [Desulfosarcina ovata]BBO85217.1 hypothetical protein DSCO28_57830 [Desulfosarcina ovata subsp. sediminis]BBO92111.1 hypothetical protein DSCOOX_52910 [Desulfosarcina ovata subsp. ovata]